jgi:hypothetical protein
MDGWMKHMPLEKDLIIGAAPICLFQTTIGMYMELPAKNRVCTLGLPSEMGLKINFSLLILAPGVIRAWVVTILFVHRKSHRA